MAAYVVEVSPSSFSCYRADYCCDVLSVVALFANFFAPQSSRTYIAEYVYAPPQQIHLFQDGKFAPFVYGYTFERDPISFKKTFAVDEETIIPIGLFVHGEEYELLGIF